MILNMKLLIENEHMRLLSSGTCPNQGKLSALLSWPTLQTGQCEHLDQHYDHLHHHTVHPDECHDEDTWSWGDCWQVFLGGSSSSCKCPGSTTGIGFPVEKGFKQCQTQIQRQSQIQRQRQSQIQSQSQSQIQYVLYKVKHKDKYKGSCSLKGFWNCCLFMIFNEISCG